MLFRRVLTAQLKRRKSSAVGANTVLDFQEIPSPKGLPLIGTTLSLLAQGSTKKLHKYIDNRHKQLGSIFKERLGPVSCVFVSDPEVIRDVFWQEGKYPMHVIPDAWVHYNEQYGCPRGLFFMDGEKWWHNRKIMNKFLLKDDIKWIQNSCDIVGDNLIQHLHNNFSESYYKNLKETLYKWSLDVIVSILLGAESYKRHHKALDDRVTKLAEIVHLVFQTTAKLALIPVSLASKLKIPQWRNFVESVHHTLHDAKSLVSVLNTLDPSDDGLLRKLLHEKMDFQEIERIIVDLILAAGDTTAVTFEWMLYLIAKDQEVQKNLRSNSELSKYVLKETLRMYPIATFLTRILPEDSILGGYEVPKGTLVVMSIYTSGRDERCFKDSQCFKPERWDRKGPYYNINMQKASLPFATGLRSCVGKRIAETQLQMTITKIVRNFEIELCNKNQIDIVMKMVAHPSEPLQLKLKKL